jgi:hypothetical protein
VFFDIHNSVNYKKFMTSLRQYMQCMHFIKHSRVSVQSISEISKAGVPSKVLDVGRTVCPACTGSTLVSHDADLSNDKASVESELSKGGKVQGIQIRV